MQNLLKNKSLLWSVVGIVVLVIGVVVALTLIPQEQDTRKDAAVTGGKAKVFIAPATISVAAGETKPIKVSFSTGGEKINTITMVMTSNNSAQFLVENITKSPQLPTGWQCGAPINRVDATAIRMAMSCTYTTPGGFSASSATQVIDLFSFSVKGVAAGSATFTFNTTESTISRSVDSNAPADTATDVLSIDLPAPLAITVTGTTTPSAAVVTITAPTVSCSATDFTVNATIKRGTTAVPATTVSFAYNGVTKNATSDAQGALATTFTKAATTMNVVASGTGITSTPVAVTIPTNCPTTPTDTDKRILLNYDGLSCTSSTVNITAEAKEDDRVWQDVLITFKYDNQTKTATTNASGKASVAFPLAASNMNVEATATDFDKGSIEIKKATDCSTTASDVSCNGQCSTSRTCTSGLTCLGGFCRDSRCSSDTSCGCADVDVAAQQGTTQLPQSGFDQTTTMAVLGLLFLLGGSQLLWSSRQKAESISEDLE